MLGLSDREFLRRTPHELGLLLDAFVSMQEIADGRVAIVASLLANIHRDQKKRSKAYTPADFMPNRRGGAGTGKATGKKKQTMTEQLEHLKAITALFGGSIAPRLGKMTAAQAAQYLKAKGE
jgi:hypothetical protein